MLCKKQKSSKRTSRSTLWIFYFIFTGASLEFLIRPINLMKENGIKSSYLNTGTWARSDSKAQKLWRNANVVGDSSDKNYTYIPKGYTIPEY